MSHLSDGLEKTGTQERTTRIWRKALSFGVGCVNTSCSIRLNVISHFRRRQICVLMFDVNINVILGREMRFGVCRVIYFV